MLISYLKYLTQESRLKNNKIIIKKSCIYFMYIKENEENNYCFMGRNKESGPIGRQMHRTMQH